MSAEVRLTVLAERWARAQASERANAQAYLIELTEALGVSRPGPSGCGYQFELPIRVVNPDGTETTKFADLFKADCFVLEAKDEEDGKPTDVLLRKAYGQGRGYVSHIPGQLPPYLLVLDVAKTLIVWDRWSGTYGGFNAGRRIDLRTLANNPEHIALLRDIWENPQVRNTAARAEAVTREIATKLAKLASSLESRGYGQERVSKFLMRCVFTMFAEDIGLLDDEPFRKAIKEIGFNDPDGLRVALEQLWQAMDAGTHFGYRKLLRFNGHFFKEWEALPLTREDLVILYKAAEADWADVEPTIFGTLLVRALNPKERHRLGAEYTPREYVERLVRPTIEEPVRERWVAVQTDVLQLRGAGKKKQALKRLHDFHAWLRSLRVLDPACGSGNFLYVALATLKQVELEVFRLMEEITGQRESAVEEVSPSQFYGIEVNLWAREIAELTLWIGYHQWWVRTHGNVRPPEPVLRDTETFENRDAVLAWDEIREVSEKATHDPTPRLVHPVTGDLVPDSNARRSYFEHVDPYCAPWPKADFIVGNPPYMGGTRMREAFGDGYVDALRSVYPEMPEGADYVMFWWRRAALEVLSGRVRRAGLITTNSITQRRNRGTVSEMLDKGAQVIWAVPDHPWVDEQGSAAVRVAMTVLSSGGESHAVRIDVDDEGLVVRQSMARRLNADFSATADIARAALEPLVANRGLSYLGILLNGPGFILEPDEARHLIKADPRNAVIVKPYVNGRDLARTSRGAYVIDFGDRSEEEARDYALLYDIVRDRVKPHRDANRNRYIRENWWRFHRIRQELRDSLAGLPRFVVTPETIKNRFFVFLDGRTAPDHSLVCIPTDDAFYLGVLSSTIHLQWLLASGGRLGVGNDPRYNKQVCFEPFPFPDSPIEVRDRVRDLAERLDAHRKDALERDDTVTMTGMYNVVEKLRAGEALTPKERKVHEVAACGVLRDLHDELDRLVADAYGWPWPMETEEILQRLVDLHDLRAAEESVGMIRWLRPDYQRPKFAADQEVIPGTEGISIGPEEVARALVDWPQDVLDQISALRAAVGKGSGTPEEIASTFRGARRQLVVRHLETLEILGEVRRDDQGRFHAVAEPVAAIAA
jgi:hypothetical protein